MLIEGENLEVLRILQKSYYGKVKMIYIDPPYNTGKDSFVYPDDYSETLEEYQRRTGAKDASGSLNKESLWKQNSKESGQYHSAWLSMMYPRLFLARNLLRDDGVILISIDDNEAANLKLLCDEIFGAENLVAQFVWNNEGNVDQQSKIKGVHEYVICYSKNIGSLGRPTVIDPNIKETSKLFNDTIENSITKNGPANPESILLLPIGFPANFSTGILKPRSDKFPKILDQIEVEENELVSPARVSSGWSSRNLIDLFIKNGFAPILDSEGKETWFELTESGAIYSYKKRADDQGHVLSVIRNVGTTKQNSGMLARWGIKFSYPKPVFLVRYLTSVFVSGDEDSIILDFFAGSGTTAQAVMELNAEDGGTRQSICVQYPEPLDEKSEAYKAGYRNIADITRARIQKVIEKLQAEQPEQNKDLACAHFTIAPSNFKIWQSDLDDGDALRNQLKAFQDGPLDSGTSQDAQRAKLSELFLKLGLGALGVHAINKPKTLPSGLTVHRLKSDSDRRIFFCFEPYQDALKDELIQSKAKRKQLVLLNSCFQGPKADEQLSNLKLELAGLEIELVVI